MANLELYRIFVEVAKEKIKNELFKAENDNKF